MNIIEKYEKPFQYASILMSLFVAYQFLSLWLNPQPTDVSKIASLTHLMVLEFFMVHSGVFMAVLPKKFSLFVLIPFYGLFAWGFASSTDNNEILIIYLIVVFNRMRFAFSDVSPEIRKKAIILSVIAAITYFVMIFIVSFNPDRFNEYGLSEAFLNSISYFEKVEARGGFTNVPHTAMAFGFIYYCVLALSETILLHINMRDRKKRPRLRRF